MSRVPAGSWDAHVHVFGPADKYPVCNRDALYHPPAECDVIALEALHGAIGFHHAVLVQPTVYGPDHRLLFDILKSAPPGRYVGVAIVNDAISDRELLSMHEAGIRGARFNFGRKFKLGPSPDEFRRTLERLRSLGWFVKIFGYGDDFMAVADELMSIDCMAVIDHIGGPEIESGIESEGFQFLLDLLRRPNWWGMLSNGDTRSKKGSPWTDVTPFGRAFYEAAPDRCLWGSDWPHVHRFVTPGGSHQDYGLDHKLDQLTLLRRYLPDEKCLAKVLVDNPARFFENLRTGLR